MAPMIRLLVACAAVMTLAGCPKNVPDNVSGTDEERMDQYSAQLEETRSRSGQDMTCDDWCSLKGKVCKTSSSVCEIAGKKTDRADFQTKCVSSQEECARFTDSCGSCKK